VSTLGFELMQSQDSSARPPIPEDIKRRVRQRCGFACVICRSPIYDYDHIVDYAIVKAHTFENLVLLCTRCHRKKRKGLVTIDVIRAALVNGNRRDFTESDVIYADFRKAVIGANIVMNFGGDLFDIKGFGKASFRRSENRLLLSAELQDHDGAIALRIIDNEYAISTKVWDASFVGNVLELKGADRRAFARVTFDAESKTMVFHGRARVFGNSYLKVNASGIFLDEILLAQSNLISSCTDGLMVSDETLPGAFYGGANVGCQAHFTHGAGFSNCLSCTSCVVSQCRWGFAWSIDCLKMIRQSKRRGRS
jgi:hypothetical protein